MVLLFYLLKLRSGTVSNMMVGFFIRLKGLNLHSSPFVRILIQGSSLFNKTFIDLDLLVMLYSEYLRSSLNTHPPVYIDPPPFA